MISPAWGSIWIPITSTMNSFRPLNPYLASAIAARNASTIEIVTVAPTMIRLFLTSAQKYGRSIASEKCENVGLLGSHVGFSATISSSDLKAVEIIQNTGNTTTTNTPSATTFRVVRVMRPRVTQ